jgi:hypothetical protein
MAITQQIYSKTLALEYETELEETN